MIMSLGFASSAQPTRPQGFRLDTPLRRGFLLAILPLSLPQPFDQRQHQLARILIQPAQGPHPVPLRFAQRRVDQIADILWFFGVWASVFFMGNGVPILPGFSAVCL
jgi:hypothetical protein